MLHEGHGQKGIDTTYEREIIDYKAELDYETSFSQSALPLESIIPIQRAMDFRLTSIIKEYTSLIQQIQDLLNTIKNRQDEKIVNQLQDYLENQNYTKAYEIENQYSACEQTGDYECYTVLYQIKKSIEKQRSFLIEYMQSQIDQTFEKAIEKEKKSIHEWEVIEKEIYIIHQANVNHDDEDELKKIEKQIEKKERIRQQKANFHKTLADLSFTHKNRCALLKSILVSAEELLAFPHLIIGENVFMFLQKLSSLSEKEKAQAHLKLMFRKIKKQLEAHKNKYIMIEPSKERFASEKYYMHQQLQTQTEFTIKEWLYQQDDQASESLNLFSEIMISSLKESKKQYEKSLSHLLHLYQNEAEFYEKYFNLLRKKEQIRKFYSILEDFKEAKEISDEWIKGYMETHGYSS